MESSACADVIAEIVVRSSVHRRRTTAPLSPESTLAGWRDLCEPRSPRLRDRPGRAWPAPVKLDRAERPRLNPRDRCCRCLAWIDPLGSSAHPRSISLISLPLPLSLCLSNILLKNFAVNTWPVHCVRN